MSGHSPSKDSTILTPRRVLVGHAAVVVFLDILLFRSNGDLHAVYPPFLYAFVIPSVCSVVVFPVLCVVAVARNAKDSFQFLAVESLLTIMHVWIVTSGMASY